MMSFCMFRETLHAPIFMSYYTPEKGTINGVPESKFNYIPPKFFIDEYKLPFNYGLPFAKEYYILALNLTNGLVAYNFYDIGIAVITEENIVVLFKEGLNIKVYEEIDRSQNMFKYNKFPIGIYKTVIRQLDVKQYKCLLYVDDNGDMLTSNGIVNIGIKTPRTLEDISKIKGTIKVWREGYDGILIDDDGTEWTYKIVDNKLEMK